MARQAPSVPDTQKPKPRIVQFRNRRYSVRLEPVFWQALDRLAARANMRLGRYVAGLAEGFRGNNFSSHLRVLCMLEAEQALTRMSLRPGRASLVELIETSFTPALVLSRYRTIVAHNGSFADWMGAENPPPAGADLTSVIQVRTRRPLNEVWLEMISGALPLVEANVLHVEPGRVLTAHARFVALPAPEEAEFYAVLWIAPARRQTPSAPLRHPLAQR